MLKLFTVIRSLDRYYAAIGGVKRQSKLDEERGCFSTGTILQLIVFYAQFLKQLLPRAHYLYYVKLQDRPCHLQTPARECISE